MTKLLSTLGWLLVVGWGVVVLETVAYAVLCYVRTWRPAPRPRWCRVNRAFRSPIELQIRAMDDAVAVELLLVYVAATVES